MFYKLSELEAKNCYKLLTGLVIPRPIAFVSTSSETGQINAAPFSFFNIFGEAPALLVLGMESRPDGRLKDSARNIRNQGEFVVNLVDEAIAEAMNICAADMPSEISEPEMAGLTTQPAELVNAPRLSESPVNMECQLRQLIICGPNRHLFLAEILAIHVRDGLVDPISLHVDPVTYAPIGRLAGSWYSRQHDRFEMKRPNWGSSIQNKILKT